MMDSQTREQASINAAVFIENDRLRNLLQIERRTAKEKSRRLEKAEHDRQRYARRIRLLGSSKRTSRRQESMMPKQQSKTRFTFNRSRSSALSSGRKWRKTASPKRI